MATKALITPEQYLATQLERETELVEEYRVWGVQHIWLIEPDLKRIHVYDHGSLREVSRLELPQFGFAVTSEQVFA